MGLLQRLRDVRARAVDPHRTWNPEVHESMRAAEHNAMGPILDVLELGTRYVAAMRAATEGYRTGRSGTAYLAEEEAELANQFMAAIDRLDTSSADTTGTL